MTPNKFNKQVKTLAETALKPYVTLLEAKVRCIF